jgi:hypothetical protein
MIFNVESLMSLAKLYPDDFNSDNLRDLRHQHCLYIANIRADDRLSNINTIGELSQKWWPQLKIFVIHWFIDF